MTRFSMPLTMRAFQAPRPTVSATVKPLALGGLGRAPAGKCHERSIAWGTREPNLCGNKGPNHRTFVRLTGDRKKSNQNLAKAVRQSTPNKGKTTPIFAAGSRCNHFMS